MRRGQMWLLPAFVAVAFAACAGSFDPPSYLNDLRVIGIVADPPEAGPGQTITLRPAIFVPPGERLERLEWTFCPVSLGSAAGYACVVPACEVGLTADGQGAASADPLALAAACLAAVGGAGAPAGEPPDRLDVLFRLTVASSSGLERQAVLTVPVWTQAFPAAPNRHPVIASVAFDGAIVEPGGSAQPAADPVAVRVVTDPASLDTYTDEAGRQAVEPAIVSFHATAGRFEQDRADGTDVEADWKPEKLLDGDTAAAIWIVVRDLRGGMAVAGPFRLPIAER